jgi:hypothetical protein
MVLADRAVASTTPTFCTFAVAQVVIGARKLGAGPERAERVFKIETLA